MSGTHILVVEDQRAAAGALKMRLRGLGYDVSAVARDGIEAIEKAAALRPDLILMDIRLGDGIDGIEAARRIRSKLDIPVVFLSAHVDQKLLDRARATRPAGFINKPFTTKDLLTAIDFALHGRGSSAPGPTPNEDDTLDEAATDGLISTDGDGRISYADRVAERITGQPRRYLLDRQLAEVLVSLYELTPDEAVALVTRMLGGDGEERLFRPVAGGKPGLRVQADVLTPLFDTRGQRYGVALKLLALGPATAPGSDTQGLQSALMHALDAVPNGVLCVNADLKVEHMNRCARDLLGRNRGLECRNGVLTIRERTLDGKLRELVRAALHRGRQQGSDATGVMFVGAPMSGEHIEIMVAPVPVGSGDPHQARALVYLFDANSQRNVSHDVLTGLYGLSQTEAKLVQLMSNGMMLDEAAEELSISVHTARTHLKHIFHKTGLNRQAELIHRIGCGPASLLLQIAPVPGLRP